MGVGEGKSVGQWYGPNTVAQVLKYVPRLLTLARASAAEGNEGSLALLAFSGPSEGSSEVTVPRGLRRRNLFLVRVCPPGSWEPLQSPQIRQSPLLSGCDSSATGARPARRLPLCCQLGVSGAQAGLIGVAGLPQAWQGLGWAFDSCPCAGLIGKWLPERLLARPPLHSCGWQRPGGSSRAGSSGCPPLPGRKLAVFDTWSALAVHVAMDNTVVMADISE